MIQTAIWVPPSLCGCTFKMTADFTEGSVVDGVSYRHPKAFTITALELLSTCDEHKPNTLEMPDVSGLFDDVSDRDTLSKHLSKKRGISSLLVQHRGYLRYPIDKPTPAEILYTYFYFHRGQTHRLVCGCSSHVHICDKGNHTYKEHPHHGSKCHFHHNDTVDMKMARQDHDEFHRNLTPPEKVN